MDPKSSTSKDVADSSDTEPEVFTQPLTPAEEKRREDERKDEAQRRRLDAQLKQLGYKGPGDLKSVIMAIMQDDFPTTPGPAEAALMEKMRAEVCA